MGRQAKRCPKSCLKHLFILKPVHYSAFFSRESSMSFCPQNLLSQPTYPKFNRDRKHYTASFILASDQIKVTNNNDTYLAQHERFKQQQFEQKAQIFIPKPRDKNSYCNVCKQIYDDYQEHIDSLTHKKQIEKSLFNKDLIELCQNYFQNGRNSDKGLNYDEIDLLQTKKQMNEYSQTFISQYDQKNEIQLPELLFPIRSTKQNLDEVLVYKGVKSFHQYEDNAELNKDENHVENNFQNNFIQNSIFKQINENCFIPNFGCFKTIEQTASPIKSRFGKPIILTNTICKLDD